MKPTPRKLAFVLAAADQATLILNRFDHCQNSFGVGFDLLETSFFDQSEVDLGARLLELRRRVAGDGVVVVDCGANIGVHTIAWAKRMTGWGSVLAIEAQERLFYALAGNIALNNCFNASAILAVISSTTGTMAIPVPDYLTPASFGSLELKQRAATEFIGQVVNYSDDALVPVRCVTLDSLSRNRIDLIKMDVEGMELDVLNGATETMRCYRPVVMAESRKTGRRCLTDFLERCDYFVCHLGANLLAIHRDDAILPSIDSIPHLKGRVGRR